MSTTGSVLRVVAALLGVGLLVGAAVFGGLPALNELEKRKQVRAAEPTDATVRSTSVDSVAVNDDRVSDTTDYAVHVTYEYTVRGRTYTSSALDPPGTGGAGAARVDTRDEAESLADRYERGETVTAHYLPGDPSTAFLRSDTDPLVVLALPVGFALLPGAIGLLLLALAVGVVDPRGLGYRY